MNNLSKVGEKLLTSILAVSDEEALMTVLKELNCDIKDIISFVQNQYPYKQAETITNNLIHLNEKNKDEFKYRRESNTQVRLNTTKRKKDANKNLDKNARLVSGAIQSMSNKKAVSVVSRTKYVGSGFVYTKTDMINGMVENAGITKAAAKKALDSFVVDIEGALQKGNRVSLVGFGSWSVTRRTAREARNPQTGKAIKIKAKNVIKFKPGSELSKAIN